MLGKEEMDSEQSSLGDWKRKSAVSRISALSTDEKSALLRKLYSDKGFKSVVEIPSKDQVDFTPPVSRIDLIGEVCTDPIVWEGDSFEVMSDKLKGLQKKPSRKKVCVLGACAILVALMIALVSVYFVVYKLELSETANSVEITNLCTVDAFVDCVDDILMQLEQFIVFRVAAHYIFTFGSVVLTVSVLICLLSQKVKLPRRKFHRQKDDQVDLWQYAPTSFNRAVRDMVIDGVCFAAATKKTYPRLVAFNCRKFDGSLEKFSEVESPDKNWGKVYDRDQGRFVLLNYRAGGTNSAVYIAELASAKWEALECKPWETTRGYMFRLYSVCPQMDIQKVKEFIGLYEDAQFSHEVFNDVKWRQLESCVDYFEQYFKRFSHPANQQKRSALT